MRRIEAVRVANGPNLLAASNLLTFSHNDSIKMGIERIGVLYLTLFHKGMPDDNYVSPGAPKISRKRDDPIAGCKNRIAKICSATSLPYPILAKMTVRSEAPRNAITVCVRSTDRVIKAVCKSCHGFVGIGQRSRSDQPKHDKKNRLFAHGAWF